MLEILSKENLMQEIYEDKKGLICIDINGTLIVPSIDNKNNKNIYINHQNRINSISQGYNLVKHLYQLQKQSFIIAFSSVSSYPEQYNCLKQMFAEYKDKISQIPIFEPILIAVPKQPQNFMRLNDPEINEHKEKFLDIKTKGYDEIVGVPFLLIEYDSELTQPPKNDIINKLYNFTQNYAKFGKKQVYIFDDSEKVIVAHQDEYSSYLVKGDGQASLYNQLKLLNKKVVYKPKLAVSSMKYWLLTLAAIPISVTLIMYYFHPDLFKQYNPISIFNEYCNIDCVDSQILHSMLINLFC